MLESSVNFDQAFMFRTFEISQNYVGCLLENSELIIQNAQLSMKLFSFFHEIALKHNSIIRFN